MGINGTLWQHQLGRELRRLREDAGLTLEAAAPRLDWSVSKLNRIETGGQGVDVHGVRSMLDLYDVGGDRWTEIIDMAREARQKGWWHAYGINNAGFVALEARRGRSVRVPTRLGTRVLQTADYAEAVFRGSLPSRTETEIKRTVQVRLRRQGRLTEDPPWNWWPSWTRRRSAAQSAGSK